MIKKISGRKIAVVLIFLGLSLALWFLKFGNYLQGDIFKPDFNKAREINPFITGIVVPILTLGTAILVYENLRNTAKQNFSSNVFKLIELHNKLVDNLKSGIWQISSRQNPSTGKDFFDDLAERICYDYNHLPIKLNINNPSSNSNKLQKREDTRTPNTKIDIQNAIGIEKLNHIYEYYFHVHQSDLGHYFRNLYYIVKYIDEANFRKAYKVDHIKILRSLLSNYELLLLAYNCLHEYGENFYPLVEKYDLLKSLNDESRVPEDYEKRIIDIDVLREAYSHLKREHLAKSKIKKHRYVINKVKFFGNEFYLLRGK